MLGTQAVQPYFMEFIAININKSSRKNPHSMKQSKQLMLKFIMHQNNRNIGQSPQLINTQTIQNTIKCLNANLPLTLHLTQPSNQWTLTVLGRQYTPLDQQQQKFGIGQNDTSGKKQLKKLGHCEINPLVYAEVFNQCQKTKFQQNIQLSTSLSLQYQVFIHRSRELLDKILRSRENDTEEEMIDTAFRKRPGGSRKIRYVELNDNRETSMKSQDFSISRQPQIASLKKSGVKYVPIKGDNFDGHLKDRKGRENNLQRKIKPLPPTKVSRKSTSRISDCTKKENESVSSYRSSDKKMMDMEGRRSQFPWRSLFGLLGLMVVVWLMMFPSRKI